MPWGGANIENECAKSTKGITTTSVPTYVSTYICMYVMHNNTKKTPILIEISGFG